MALLGCQLRKMGLGWPSGRSLGHACICRVRWLELNGLQQIVAPSQAAHPFTAQATTKGHANRSYTTCSHQIQHSLYGYSWVIVGQDMHHGSAVTISQAGKYQVDLISNHSNTSRIHSHDSILVILYRYLDSFVWTGIFSGSYLRGKDSLEGTGRQETAPAKGMRWNKKSDTLTQACFLRHQWNS